MRAFLSLLCGALILAGATAAFAGVACEKCTHDLQVQYRACIKNGKSQEVCGKEEQAAAQTCITICQQNKAPDGK